MEDVVAVEIADRNRGTWAVLTWGRVYSDEEALIAAVERVAPRMGFSDVEKVSVCYHLGDVKEYQYFYEGLMHFAVRMATEPYTKKKWVRAQRDDDVLLRTVYLLQPPGYRN